MKQIVIFGNTDFARQLAYFIETDTEDKVVAYTVNKDYAQEDEYVKKLEAAVYKERQNKEWGEVLWITGELQ